MYNSEGQNAEFAAADRLSNRTRSASGSSTHKRSLSGSLFSRLSFLRMSQATGSESGARIMDHDGDNEDLPSMPPINSEASERGKAMAAVIQQQRRTRRRRGSLRKTALLGTRLESRDKRAFSKNVEAVRAEAPRFQADDDALRPHSPKDKASSPPMENNDFASPRGGFNDDAEDPAQPSWFRPSSALKNSRPTVARRRQGLAQHTSNTKNNSNNNHLGEETATDDEELVSFPRINTNNSSAVSGAPNPSTKTTSLHAHPSSPDSYYPLQPDAAYRPVRAKSSPLATHPVEMKSNTDITWDYSETESWGWIILMVTWLVFVVGMGSCFEVWSWAWDVGETPYAPPELEDDPTLPIVGYYPALIILTAVMSWVWVVVAWIGMKYFKHANISGDDS
ncbi:uncharacterized protein N7484_002079 [Penicillium longicatenatum]|uniref:uncharacterized protein n=1 Tax=Penicillium longicatenatum TaxID=1561947 RepID=UPI00254838AF|nr:uncharacterized protein N7484_002079 [Penicillium longicatenatum]KAJ5658430.1 hypothetical protein N7484_002079 [Penicillium longicatenatum]